MKHKISCLVCGKEGIVEIDNETHRIIGRDWHYYGRINANYSSKTDRYLYKVISWKPDFVTEKVLNPNYDSRAKPKMAEYWECEKCNRE